MCVTKIKTEFNMSEQASVLYHKDGISLMTQSKSIYTSIDKNAEISKTAILKLLKSVWFPSPFCHKEKQSK